MARCPGCNEVHYIANQTHLLEPGHQARSYRAGVVHEKRVDPRILTVDLWEQQWWRMRAPIAGAKHVDVLHWIEDVFVCSCERVLAPVLRFAIGETTAGLE